MQPVDQRVIDPDKGDCFSACIASILELPLGAIPVYHSDETGSAWDRWVQWFRDANLTLICLTHHGPVPGYAIRSIPSYTYDARLHAVVTFDGVVVHDPSPNRLPPDDDRYTEWARHWVIVPIDPMKSIDRDRLVGGHV
jgi:hypothetical protein